jgi:hypothetical protein
MVELIFHHADRFCISSYSYLAPLRNIWLFQTPTICSTGLVLAHCRPLDRDRRLFVESTQCIFGWVLTWMESAGSWSSAVTEVTTPNARFCTWSFHLGPLPAIYTSIPIICYDFLLVILASTFLVKHLKERRTVKLRPNTYVIMIVRYHIIYFVLWVCIICVFCRYLLTPARNLANQISTALLWAHLPVWYSQTQYPSPPEILMLILTDTGDPTFSALQRYCTVYSRAPPHH